MKYCIVVSVGYGVAILALWETLAFVWALENPVALNYAAYGFLAAAFAFLLGSAINCAFELAGSFFHLSSSLSIKVGWVLLMLTYFILSTPVPTNLWDFVSALVEAGMSVANPFPSSHIFYELGNLTLTAVGIR